MCRRLLCYGDSNTYGYDPRSYLGGRYPESVRWTALLRGYGWDVINRGENGRSIPRGDGEIHAAIQSLCRVEADILTVMLGSNDLLQPSCPSARECADRMERFLATLLYAEGWEKSREVLLIAPPPMALGDWVQDEEIIAASRRMAECYEDTARMLNIGFADAGSWGVDLTYDGVHFSEMGHLAFAKGIQQTLSTLLPNEAESLFELFYRRTAPLCFINLVITGFIEKSICGVFLKKRKSFNKNIYPGSLFRHRFSHKPVSFSAYKTPQIELAICKPASDEVVVRYRNAHTHPRFFENLPRRNSPFDMLLPA